MKRKTLKKSALVAAITLGAALLATGPASAHGPGTQGYQGGYGMMGHMGSGMMGHMGRGMMGYKGSGMMGHMGQGMMGHMGSGMMGQDGYPYRQEALKEDLTVERVTKFLEHHLSHMGNDRLKVGGVKVQDDDTIVAEIVTVDDSLVQRIEFDRKTGAHHMVR